MKFYNRFFTLVVALLGATSLLAQAPAGYYTSCEGKKQEALLVELYNIIGDHTVVSYDGLWTVYKTSDVRDDGTVWDMYSTKHWRVGSEQCGNYSSVGDCYNREHSFPKSWFNDAKPMYSDAFHIYPTDGKVNGQRSNHPYGECANGTTLSSSGGVKALGKLGTCTFPGYSGTVFEPDDEYKGDFARSYFYMAACYNNKIAGWSSAMLSGNNYPAYKTWAVNLLLKWHRQDPVSQKEIDRNEVVYSYQKNRNPFIDHPSLAEHIWGDKTSQGWTSNEVVEPEISTPIDGSTVDMGTTAVNEPLEYEVVVKGVALVEDVVLSISGTGFSVSPTTLSCTQVNSENGAKAVVKYLSATDAEAQGSLTVYSDDIASTISLSARAVSTLYAKPATEVGETSFVANWVNVHANNGSVKYSLSVCQNGKILDEYPKEVSAVAEKFSVQELNPETTYSYKISYGQLESNEITVTTATPIPYIQFIVPDDLTLMAAIGEVSQDVEIGVDTWYVDGEITISVDSPFELSADKTTWAQSITLSDVEDHFYLRLRGDKTGEYSATLSAVSAVCEAEPIDIKGVVSAPSVFVEDFEAEGEDSYSAHDYVGDVAQWRFSDVGIWSSDKAYSGDQAVRFGKTASSYIMMTEDKADGIGVISFYAKMWSTSDGQCVVCVETSTDGGTSWTEAGKITIDQTAYTQYQLPVNIAGNARLKLRQTSGKRFMLDLLEIGNYQASVESFDVNGWTAYAVQDNLIIESDMPHDGVSIYNMKGETVFNSSIKVGTTQVQLPQGLYIVVIDGDSQKILID